MHLGDPACWSHLTCPDCGRVHDGGVPCGTGSYDAVVSVAGPLDHGSAGLASPQLNATCVVLAPDASLPPAVLDRDVAFVVTRGAGTLTIEGEAPDHVELVAGRVVLVPAGSRRVLAAGTAGLAWTSVHRRREVS